MSELPKRGALLADARARLDAARDDGDAARADLLEQLHSALEEELDADEASSAGR